MIRTFLVSLVALALMLPAGLQAEQKKAAGTTEKVGSEKTFETLSAKVVGIDKATHTLTLLNDMNQRHKVQVDPAQVKNFDQIKVGDMVVVRQAQSIALTITPHKKGQKPGAGAAMTVETAAPGEKPAIEKDKVIQVSAEITGINRTNNTVDLKGPEGNTFRVGVREPSRLEGLKKGDMVSLTRTKVLAISVQPAPGK